MLINREFASSKAARKHVLTPNPDFDDLDQGPQTQINMKPAFLHIKSAQKPQKKKNVSSGRKVGKKCLLIKQNSTII